MSFKAGWHTLLAGYAGESPASGVLWRKTASDGNLFKPAQSDGRFKKVNGILLGTFTKMEVDNCQPDMAKLILEFAEKKTPIAKTPLIGHGSDSKAIRIGHRLKLFSAEENKRIYKEF